LSALIQDAPRRLSMGNAARQVQAAEYTEELMGERYAQLYTEVL
jgi:hypothetical protein